MKLQTKETPAGSQAPAPGGVYTLINVPLVIVGVLLLVIAVVSLLSAVQVAAAVIVFLIALAIVGMVLFAKAREAQWQHQEWTDSTPAGVQRVDGGTLFSNRVPTVISP